MQANGWYVAIGGAPVGPISLSEVVAKAYEGAIHERSLAWREGLAEWEPIASIAELVAAIGPNLHAPPPRSVARMESALAGGPPARAPGRGALESTLASARVHEHEGSPPRGFVAGSTLAARAVPEQVRAAIEAQSIPRAASRTDDAHAPAKAAEGAEAVRTSPSEVLAAGVSLRGAAARTPSARIAAAAGFGGILLGFAAGRLSAPTVPAHAAVVVPAVQTHETVMPSDDLLDDIPLPPANDAPVVVAPSPRPASPHPAPPHPAPQAPRPAPIVAAAAAPAPAPAANTSPTAHVAAPPPPPPAPSSFGSAGGSSLTEGQISMVLAQRKMQLKRACWERTEHNEGAVTVRATLNIEGDGRVSSIDATGTDPAVTACIRHLLKEWTFPATGAPTTATLPFSFVTQ